MSGVSKRSPKRHSAATRAATFPHDDVPPHFDRSARAAKFGISTQTTAKWERTWFPKPIEHVSDRFVLCDGKEVEPRSRNEQWTFPAPAAQHSLILGECQLAIFQGSRVEPCRLPSSRLGDRIVGCGDFCNGPPIAKG